jgi:cytochrome c-type biogenesis protein CcmH/NrfG
MYERGVSMQRHGVVAYAAMLLCGLVSMIAPRSLAWAQAPSDAAIFVDRAILAYDEQRYNQALQELQEALRLDPNSVEALFYQGIVYMAMKRRAEAVTAWERAWQLRPSDIDKGGGSDHIFNLPQKSSLPLLVGRS